MCTAAADTLGEDVQVLLPEGALAEASGRSGGVIPSVRNQRTGWHPETTAASLRSSNF
jgi:hypothetical protein